MAYQSGIPEATDRKNASQSAIKDNFGAIKTAFETNHGAFNGALEGKHKWASFPDQTSAPTTAASELAVYSKVSTLGALGSALHLRKESDGSEIDFTSATLAATGWCRLPCGLIMKWGLTTATGATTITYPVAATTPVFATAVYCVQLTPYGAAAANMNIDIRLQAYGGKTTFGVVATRRYQNDLDTCEFTYLAIGI